MRHDGAKLTTTNLAAVPVTKPVDKFLGLDLTEKAGNADTMKITGTSTASCQWGPLPNSGWVSTAFLFQLLL